MSHPSAEQLEAAVFGWLPEAEAREIRGHATACPTCGLVLHQNEDIQRRLSLLRAGEQRVDIAKRVLGRLEQVGRPRPSRQPVGLAVLAAALVLVGVLIASNGKVRRTMRRVRAIVPV